MDREWKRAGKDKMDSEAEGGARENGKTGRRRTEWYREGRGVVEVEQVDIPLAGSSCLLISVH